MALTFPDGFHWGCATSSHQVEGNNRNNQWWDWEQEEGNIRDGTVSGLASDHYNRFEEDFALAKELGHNAHRLSIEWSRIEPEEGRWDEKEVEHYRRVVDSLHRHGLTPFVTIHHCTNPTWFEEQGGWISPRAPDLIGRYAGYMAKQMGDAVPFWMTINEPSVTSTACYLAGTRPPAKRDPGLAMEAARHLLIAHCKIYQAIRESAPHNPPIGPVLNMIDVHPASDSEEDRRAARDFDQYWNGYWLDGISQGVVGPPVGDGEELPGTKGTWDFIGLNYYSRSVMKASSAPLGFEEVPPGPDVETSTMGLQVHPEGFHRCLMRLKTYGPPIYVTENGIATDDDEQRRRYIVRHLQWAHRAIREGADIRSYLHWSLQDNFEWTLGFQQKFGLVAVEERTLNRAPRPSAYLFRDIARANSLSDELVERYGDKLS